MSLPATLLRLPMLLAFALLVPSAGVASEDAAQTPSKPPDPHDHHAAPAIPDAATPAATPHSAWSTDAPLREGMARIEAARRTARAGDEGTTTALAATIDAAIAHMIANCRLEPDADAALHPILGELANAASTLRSRAGDEVALSTIDASLAAYASRFDHPGFLAPPR